MDGQVPERLTSTYDLLEKCCINDPDLDYPHLVSWVIFVGSARCGDLLKPQMVSASVEL